MKFLSLSGRSVNVNINKKRIKWDSKSCSKPQKLVKDFLYQYWKNHIVAEEILVPGSRMRIDLLNLTLRVAVEVSPESSHDYNKFFHKNRIGFLNSLKRDCRKEEWIIKNGYKFIELNENDLKNLNHQYFVDKFDIYL